MSARRRVELRAIECAEAYSAANGMAGSKVAPGLVLVGMAIAARLPDGARDLLARGYDADFPSEAGAINAWAERIAAGARDA